MHYIQDCDLLDMDLAKRNIYAIYDKNPKEVIGVLKAIDEGRIDGTLYTGKCACLIGTIGQLRGLAEKRTYDWDVEPSILNTFNKEIWSIDFMSPAEQFFIKILEGDTPSTSEYSKFARKWTIEWLEQKGRIK